MKPISQLPLKSQITFGKFQNIDMRAAVVTSAPMAEGTEKPCRVLTLDAGHLGTFTSVGQYALIEENELVGKTVIICCNLSPRQMGPYVSQALVMGLPHPDSPEDQAQALPLYGNGRCTPGTSVF